MICADGIQIFISVLQSFTTTSEDLMSNRSARGMARQRNGSAAKCDEALAPFVRERLASALKTDEEVMIVKEDERGVGESIITAR
jgi:hypothetical protein